ncbi:MAG: hypothetical protein K6U74_19135 [Firmicutes bacterium]|nr:hypothetical protein [Bacillota bacterium]
MAELYELVLAQIFISRRPDSNKQVTMYKVIDSLGITEEETVHVLKSLIRMGFLKRPIPRHHAFFLESQNVREFPALITPAGIEYLAKIGAERILEEVKPPKEVKKG